MTRSFLKVKRTFLAFSTQRSRVNHRYIVDYPTPPFELHIRHVTNPKGREKIEQSIEIEKNVTHLTSAKRHSKYWRIVEESVCFFRILYIRPFEE